MNPEPSPASLGGSDPSESARIAPLAHWWVEVSGFAGRFCGTCGVDEDDLDDPRRAGCST